MKKEKGMDTKESGIVVNRKISEKEEETRRRRKKRVQTGIRKSK